MWCIDMCSDGSAFELPIYLLHVIYLKRVMFERGMPKGDVCVHRELCVRRVEVVVEI